MTKKEIIENIKEMENALYYACCNIEKECESGYYMSNRYNDMLTIRYNAMLSIVSDIVLMIEGDDACFKAQLSLAKDHSNTKK